MMSSKDKTKACELAKDILTRDLPFKVNGNIITPKFILNVLKRALQKNRNDTTSFDMGVTLAADMLREDGELPEWLASFAADVLEGKRKRPNKHGPDKSAKRYRDLILAMAVTEVSSRFGVPKYTNNELSHKVTAAQIVAQTANLPLEIVHHAVKNFRGKVSAQHCPKTPKADSGTKELSETT